MQCFQLPSVLPTGCAGGFIAVEVILGLEEFQRKNATKEDIERVVANNDKQRFALKDDKGTLYIRANQGHTMDTPDPGKPASDLIWPLRVSCCSCTASLCLTRVLAYSRVRSSII